VDPQRHEPRRAREPHAAYVGDAERDAQRQQDQGNDARAPRQVPVRGHDSLRGHDPPDTTELDDELGDELDEDEEVVDDEDADGVCEGCWSDEVVDVLEWVVCPLLDSAAATETRPDSAIDAAIVQRLTREISRRPRSRVVACEEVMAPMVGATRKRTLRRP
jgi:hypothetical protein